MKYLKKNVVGKFCIKTKSFKKKSVKRFTENIFPKKTFLL